MLTRIPLLLIASLAAALIAAGCGDDDEETTTSTTTTEAATGATGAAGPQSEFAQQADEICAEGDEELDAEADTFFGDVPQGEEPSQADQQRFVEEVVLPNVEQQIDEVTALTPPEGEEELFEEFSDQAQSDLEAAKEDPSLLQRNPFTETNELGRELGLQVCGQG